ncbi:MAG: hypothetical protein P8J87_00440, partial [Verrucomicrobiales bacterium]|nr:hypothetical protein [Verrucomicrobiales bacterium]
RTAYFHLKTDETDFGIKYHIGLSNKGLRGFQDDTDGDLGGFLVVERFDVETDTTLYSGAFDFNDPAFVMTPGGWHRVWIDVTNSAGDADDVISAFIQREGEATRTVLFENSIGDRGNGQDLIYFFVASESGNLADRGLLVDNVFFSANGVLGTDPLGGGGGPVGDDFRITSVALDDVTMEVTLVWSGDAAGSYNVESSVSGVGPWREEADDLRVLTATVPMEGGSRIYRVRRTD